VAFSALPNVQGWAYTFDVCNGNVVRTEVLAQFQQTISVSLSRSLRAEQESRNAFMTKLGRKNIDRSN